MGQKSTKGIKDPEDESKNDVEVKHSSGVIQFKHSGTQLKYTNAQCEPVKYETNSVRIPFGVPVNLEDLQAIIVEEFEGKWKPVKIVCVDKNCGRATTHFYESSVWPDGKVFLANLCRADNHLPKDLDGEGSEFWDKIHTWLAGKSDTKKL